MTTATNQTAGTRSVPEEKPAIPDTLDSGGHHLILGVSPEMYGILEQLAARYHGDKADVINLAVGLLKHLAESVDQGKRVEIVSDEHGVESELMGI